jgi:HEPN domain-containing protein
MDYLSKPLQKGVYHKQLNVNFAELDTLLKELLKESKKPEKIKQLIARLYSLKGEKYYVSENLEDIVFSALNLLVHSNYCPEEMLTHLLNMKLQQKGYLPRKKHAPFSSVFEEIFGEPSKNAFLSFSPSDIFGSRILYELNDVIFVETEKVVRRPMELTFDVISITDVGVKTFKDFLMCIPHVGSTVQEIRSRKTHSTRYTFRPYHLAVKLWLDSEQSEVVTNDLRDFLRGSLRYHSDGEWRTSIVLSAIAVESVLADLYEETYKNYAPNVPLGNLYEKVKVKVKFPSEIMKAIEMVNEARISAVHRSRFPVSDREATNALYGSTTFIMWYSSNY